MVKRQTVWLSTMMVLSLMLIGYYTMNNGTQTAIAPGNSNPATTTTAVTPSSDSTGGMTTTGANVPQSSSSDFFVNYQNTVTQNLSKDEDRLLSVLTNNNASADDISQAEQQLKQVQNLQGGMQYAEEAIKAEGFKDCVLVPSANGQNITVWVQYAKPALTPIQAVKIMNVVSQQLNFPIDNISVHAHS